MGNIVADDHELKETKSEPVHPNKNSQACLEPKHLVIKKKFEPTKRSGVGKNFPYYSAHNTFARYSCNFTYNQAIFAENIKNPRNIVVGGFRSNQTQFFEVFTHNSSKKLSFVPFTKHNKQNADLKHAGFVSGSYTQAFLTKDSNYVIVYQGLNSDCFGYNVYDIANDKWLKQNSKANNIGYQSREWRLLLINDEILVFTLRNVITFYSLRGDITNPIYCGKQRLNVESYYYEGHGSRLISFKFENNYENDIYSFRIILFGGDGYFFKSFLMLDIKLTFDNCNITINNVNKCCIDMKQTLIDKKSIKCMNFNRNDINSKLYWFGCHTVCNLNDKPFVIIIGGNGNYDIGYNNINDDADGTDEEVIIDTDKDKNKEENKKDMSDINVNDKMLANAGMTIFNDDSVDYNPKTRSQHSILLFNIETKEMTLRENVCNYSCLN